MKDSCRLGPKHLMYISYLNLSNMLLTGNDHKNLGAFRHELQMALKLSLGGTNISAFLLVIYFRANK